MMNPKTYTAYTCVECKEKFYLDDDARVDERLAEIGLGASRKVCPLCLFHRQSQIS